MKYLLIILEKYEKYWYIIVKFYILCEVVYYVEGCFIL